MMGDADDVYYLHFVTVQPQYQGQGIGKALIKHITDIVPPAPEHPTLVNFDGAN